MKDRGDQQPGDPGTDAFEARLREALPAYRVPEPGPDFIEDLMLRAHLRRDQELRPLPEPSEGFVDRVLEAWTRESAGSKGEGRSTEAREAPPLPPLISLAEAREDQTRPRRAGGSLLLAGLACAAALLLAFLAGRASVEEAGLGNAVLGHQEVLVLRSQDQGFVELGSNRFNRAISRVSGQVDAGLPFAEDREARRQRALMPTLVLPGAPEPELQSPLPIPAERRRALGLDKLLEEYR